jgi:hypothetical protein
VLLAALGLFAIACSHELGYISPPAACWSRLGRPSTRRWQPPTAAAVASATTWVRPAASSRLRCSERGSWGCTGRRRRSSCRPPVASDLVVGASSTPVIANDALIVLDEVQLAGAFARTLRAVGRLRHGRIEHVNRLHRSASYRGPLRRLTIPWKIPPGPRRLACCSGWPPSTGARRSTRPSVPLASTTFARPTPMSSRSCRLKASGPAASPD